MLWNKLIGAQNVQKIELSYKTIAYSQGSTALTVPASVTENDICILTLRHAVSTKPPTPEGWNELYNEQSNPDVDITDFFAVFWRNGGANQNIPLPSSTYNNQWIIVLSTNRPAKTASLEFASYAQYADTPPNLLLPATSSLKQQLVVVGYQRNTSTGEGFDIIESPQFQYEQNIGSGATAGWSIYNLDPVDHTIGVSDRAATYNSIGGHVISFS